jgi:ribonuclease D
MGIRSYGYCSDKLIVDSLKALSKALVNIDLKKGGKKDWVTRPLGEKGREGAYRHPNLMLI